MSACSSPWGLGYEALIGKSAGIEISLNGITFALNSMCKDLVRGLGLANDPSRPENRRVTLFRLSDAVSRSELK